MTVPKSKQDYVLSKKFKFKGPGFIWWSLPQLPRESIMLDPPPSVTWVRLERCYFVWDGAVRAWHEIEDFIDGDGFAIQGPARFSDPVPGPAVVLTSMHHRLEKPIPMKGFRGFRYYEPRNGS